jgi:hypothetical protein
LGTCGRASQRLFAILILLFIEDSFTSIRIQGRGWALLFLLTAIVSVRILRTWGSHRANSFPDVTEMRHRLDFRPSFSEMVHLELTLEDTTTVVEIVATGTAA